MRELLSGYLCRQPELECVMVAGSIAARLDLSPQTIHGYVKQVYRKLEINSRGELMKRASRREL